MGSGGEPDDLGVAEKFSVGLDGGGRIGDDLDLVDVLPDVHPGDFVEFPAGECRREDEGGAYECEPFDEECCQASRVLRHDTEGNLPEVRVQVVDLDEHGSRVEVAATVGNAKIRGAPRLASHDDRNRRRCIVDAPEPVLSVRFHIGDPYDFGVESDTRGEGRVPYRRSVFVLHVEASQACMDRRWSGRQVGGCRTRAAGDTEDTGEHVRRAGGDDAEDGPGADDTVDDVMDHAVTTHCDDDVDSGVRRFQRPSFHLGATRRPHGVEFVGPRKLRYDAAVQAPREAGRSRICDEKQRAHHQRVPGTGRVATHRSGRQDVAAFAPGIWVFLKPCDGASDTSHMESTRHAETYESGGEGAILGAAAGELLVSGTRRAYGIGMQQAVVTAYHLFQHQDIDREMLAGDLLEFAYPSDGRASVYRTPDAWFSAFLEESRHGPVSPMPFRNAGASLRSVPIGLWFRKEPDRLLAASIGTTRVTHTRPESAVAAAAIGGAVAGAGFGQAGRDLILGAAEVAARAETRLGDGAAVSDAIRRAVDLADASAREISNEVMSWAIDDPAIEVAVVAVTIGSHGVDRSEVVVREAAGVGAHAADVAPLVGAIVGARSGLHRWPWPIPNDLWFAEIGRRLARQESTYEDLPDPYAVEEVLNYELATGTLVER